MPEMLPWLSNNPLIYGISRTTLIGSVLFWVAVLAILYIVFYTNIIVKEKTLTTQPAYEE
jgi:hypothetical protein